MLRSFVHHARTTLHLQLSIPFSTSSTSADDVESVPLSARAHPASPISLPHSSPSSSSLYTKAKEAFKFTSKKGQKGRRQSLPLAFYLSILTLGLLTFTISADTVIFAASLPVIAADLHASSLKAFWCGTGFLLAQAAVGPLAGSISEGVGRRSCLQVGVTLFGIGGLICGVARGIDVLIVGRVVGVVSIFVEIYPVPFKLT
jgi:Major Facilitator Superfamily